MIEYIPVYFYYLWYSIGGVKHDIFNEMISQAQPLANELKSQRQCTYGLWVTVSKLGLRSASSQLEKILGQTL